MSGRKKALSDRTVIAENRKARHAYFIEESLETGLVLCGTEIKSLRTGKSHITESHALEKDGEIWIENMYIGTYTGGNRWNHSPRRPRKLLLHRRQINKFAGKVQKQGMTLVPLCLYFNLEGRVKLELGLARGKKQHDKRETEKKRDWERDRARLMRDKG